MIARRAGLAEAISGHQERIRRLEIRPGGGSERQIEWDDGTLTSSWTGRFQSAPRYGRAYVSFLVTKVGGSLTIGTLAATAHPSAARNFWSVDAGGNQVELTISTAGAVVAAGYLGSPLMLSGSFIL